MVALPILNVLSPNHVAIEVVLTHVLLTNHVVLLQYVLLKVTRHLVHVHQDLKEILIGNVAKVRNHNTCFYSTIILVF